MGNGLTRRGAPATRKEILVVERRTSRRFDLHVPILFRWNDGSGEPLQGGGFSRDIGGGGVAVWSNEIPPHGADLLVEILLPGFPPSSQCWSLRVKGSVVRVWDEPKRNSFAVRIDFVRAFPERGNHSQGS